MKKTKKPSLSKSPVLVGRARELQQIQACLGAGKNLLLEGPVGVGKTYLALVAADGLNRPVFRVDGDSRYTEQKLSGWFDPPLVMKKGYTPAAFIVGPLTEAMQRGGILFVNELNRLPEGVQNVLLPAIDERLLAIPRFGEIRAKPGFQVIATQNPKEFVATSHLSEAILDRFELVVLDYQSEQEELGIVSAHLAPKVLAQFADLPELAVRLVRLTRKHPQIRRGASVRAAISVAELTASFLAQGAQLEQALGDAVQMALPNRIEIETDSQSERSVQEQRADILKDIIQRALKKKT